MRRARQSSGPQRPPRTDGPRIRTAAVWTPVGGSEGGEKGEAAGRKPKIVVGDEPSATVTDHELKSLFDLARKLKSEGVSIVYISHRLEEVFEVCARATIMRDGHWIATKDVAVLSREE